jgi:hypothetical protein
VQEWNLEQCRHCGDSDTIYVEVCWLVHARRSERAALHYVLSTRCRLCLGGKDGRPTRFNTAIACSVKLTRNCARPQANLRRLRGKNKRYRVVFNIKNYLLQWIQLRRSPSCYRVNTSDQTIANVKESLTEKEANSRISGGKWMEGPTSPYRQRETDWPS